MRRMDTRILLILKEHWKIALPTIGWTELKIGPSLRYDSLFLDFEHLRRFSNLPEFLF